MEVKQEKRTKGQELRSTLLYVLACIAGSFLLFHFILIPVRVTGTSMYPTLEDGSFVVARGMLFGQPQRGDIVVVDDALGEGSHIIKRVIAIGGDTIDIHDGQVFLNGQLLEENYVAAQTLAVEGSMYPVTIGDRNFFVMGDNREYSNDSRNPDIGQVEADHLRGVFLMTLKK